MNKSVVIRDTIFDAIGEPGTRLKSSSILYILNSISKLLVPERLIEHVEKNDLIDIVKRLNEYQEHCDDTIIYINLRPEQLFSLDFKHIPEWFSKKHPIIKVMDIESDLPTEDELLAYTINSGSICEAICNDMNLYQKDPDIKSWGLIVEEIRYLLSLFYLNIRLTQAVLVIGNDNPLRNVEIFPQTTQLRLAGYKNLNRKASEFRPVKYLQNQAIQSRTVICHIKSTEHGLVIDPSVLSLLTTNNNNSRSNFLVLITGEELSELDKTLMDVRDNISQSGVNPIFYIGSLGYHQLLSDLGLEEDGDGDIVTKIQPETVINNEGD